MGNDGKTIAQALPWLSQMQDYTDKVCAAITEDNGGLRCTDPAGGFCFSAKELLLHIADSRWQCLVWLTGGAERARFEAERYLVEYGGTDKPWQFKDVSVADALARLKELRDRLAPLLAQPAAAMLDSTEALAAAHTAFVERMRSAGKDTAEIAAAGPGNVVNALLFLTAHEQAHRAQIQLILRMHGLAVYRVA